MCIWRTLCLAGAALLVQAAGALAATQATDTGAGLEGLTLLVVGVVLANNIPTLLDYAKRLDPTNKIATLVELLQQTNEVLLDMRWIAGNLPTGHRTTIRTGLPTVYWRLINQGVPTSKSTTAQVDEQCGMLEAWSEVDVELADLNGNANRFRFTEAQAFIEAMNQEMASTLFYGNAGTAPEEFTGLSPRYSSLSAGNAQNILSAGGAGAAENASVWFVVWGENTIHGIFPQGSQAGLKHTDIGVETAEGTAGLGGQRLRVFRDQFQWKAGVALRDWRYVVRIANIKVSDLAANSGTQLPTAATRLQKLMAKATHRIPGTGAGTAVWYANRTVMQYLDLQSREDVKDGGGMNYENVDGKRIMTFRGFPLRTVDALLDTEAAVT